MLKQAFDSGAIVALKQFGLDKIAVGMLPSMLASTRQFARGQAGALGDMGHGLKGMLAPTGDAAARAASRSQAWGGTKGLAPTAGIVGGGLLLNHLMNGQQQQQPQQQPPLY